MQDKHPIDAYTLVHGLFGFICQRLGVSQQNTVAVAFLYEVVEPFIIRFMREDLKMNAWGYESALNIAIDVLIADIGWRLGEKSQTRSNPKVAKKIIRDSKGRKIPQKYLAGYKGERLEERKKEIEQRRDEYQDALETYGDEDNFPKKTLQKLYRPFKTDKGIKTKRSSYTDEAKKRGFTGSISNKAKVASEYYGGKIDPRILKEVNSRGMAAAISSGHRPGANAHSWGIARVNSFLVGGKTFFTADKDLATRGIVHKETKKTIVPPLPEEVQAAIKKERFWKG